MTNLRIKISNISKDHEIQNRLKELDDHDGSLSPEEIDRDQDGYLDLNETSQSWSKSVFQRVESALFSKRLIRFKHDSPSLLKISLNNESQTQLKFKKLESFDPQIQPGKYVDLRNIGLGSLATGKARLNLEASLQADDPQTQLNEGLQNIAQYLENVYFTAHPEILEAFNVTNIHQLTPKQAVQLASYISIERIEYSSAQAQSDIFGTTQVVNDGTPIEQLFNWEQDEDGNGVCRNYASIARGVLDALKQMQDPETSQLNTTYAIELGLEDDETEPGFIQFHAWNAYVTLTDTGIEAVVLDSTWADSSSLSEDPARVGSNEIKLDYTEERFLTLVNNFEEKNLIDHKILLSELLNTFLKHPAPQFEQVNETNVSELFRKPPITYLIGSKILQILDGSTELLSTLNPHTELFIKSYAESLKNHLNQMLEARKYLNSKAYLTYMLTPFLDNLKNFLSLVESLFIDSEEYLLGMSHIKQLLQESFEKLGQYYISNIYQYLTISESIGNTDIADECLSLISSH